MTAELVELDVIVTDSRGRPVRDLQKDDFEVYEDGVKQEIVAFERVIEPHEPGTVAPKALSEVRLEKDKAQESRDISLRTNSPSSVRYSVISISVGKDEDRALLAARKEKLFQALEELISPTHRIAVTLGSELILDFTSDLELVKDTFWKIISTPNFFRAYREDSTHAEFAQIQQETGGISLNELLARQEAIPDVDAEQAEYLQRIGLIKLRQLIRALGVLPGRKHFIWFNGGLGYSDELERLISEANRAGVSFYIIDVRGLVAIPPVPIDQLGIADPRKKNVAKDVFRRLRRYSNVSGLSFGSRVLANSTGGRFYGLNWPEVGLRQVAVDAHNYYRLAYYPRNPKADGKFRHIRVKVKRSGVTIRTRAGYLAPKPFGEMTVEERRDHLLRAVLSGKSYRELPTSVHAYVFPQPGGEAVVPIGIEVEGTAIPLRREGGRYRGRVEVVMQVMTEAGHLVETVTRAIELKLREGSYRRLRTGVFRYSVEVKVRPGQYRLRV
ncbi:VWA domain-containing protein, partial [Candidatus Parcubacteria bacterium]